jgi:hypothetical protein
MRVALLPLLLLASAVSWAGGEVPWPKDSEQAIYLREMGGLWVSEHLDAPQRMFFFNLERGGISEACPFVLRAFEVDTATNTLITAGGGVFCSDKLDVVTILMYDFDGKAQNYMTLTGLKKPATSSFMGYQMLGVTLFTYGAKPEVIIQDTFYMISQ